jgi:CRP-like cAMP-binding protein
MHTLNALQRKLSSHSQFDSAERKILAAQFGRPQVFAARQELDFEKYSDRNAYLVEEGWAYTYKILPNGNRQVVEFGIAGDILGFCELQMRRGDLLAATVTPAILHELTAGSFAAVMRSAPRIAAALLWSGAQHQGMMVEHLIDLGRRSATQRVAHFMLELWQRLNMVSLGGKDGFKCPLSQPLIADALGLTAIHLNRTLRELRIAGLMVMGDGFVEIRDEKGLAQLAGYDSTYLDQAFIPKAVPYGTHQAKVA